MHNTSKSGFGKVRYKELQLLSEKKGKAIFLVVLSLSLPLSPDI